MYPEIPQSVQRFDQVVRWEVNHLEKTPQPSRIALRERQRGIHTIRHGHPVAHLNCAKMALTCRKYLAMDLISQLYSYQIGGIARKTLSAGELQVKSCAQRS